MLGHLTRRDVTAIQIDMVFDGKEREVVFGSVSLPYDSTDLPPSKEMVSLINYCSHTNYPLFIGCDNYSHNLCWGSTGNNNRGDALLEYLATTDLYISNKGNKPTFVVTGRQEVTDINLATSNIDLYLCKWRESDDYSISDHKYIDLVEQQNSSPYPHGVIPELLDGTHILRTLKK